MIHQEKYEDEGNEKYPLLWMITIADVMFLIIAFVVMLFSCASLRGNSFQNTLGSIQGALGMREGPSYTINLGKLDVSGMLSGNRGTTEHLNVSQVKAQLSILANYPDTCMYEDERGIHIVLPNDCLFDMTDNTLKKSAYPLLKQIGDMLNEHTNNIMIEGYTDNFLIQTDRFPSKWHLSSAQASSVAAFLHTYGKLSDTRMSVAGYAESAEIMVENRKKDNCVIIVMGK
jgi:chemotaxis protein MotB